MGPERNYIVFLMYGRVSHILKDGKPLCGRSTFERPTVFYNSAAMRAWNNPWPICKQCQAKEVRQ